MKTQRRLQLNDTNPHHLQQIQENSTSRRSYILSRKLSNIPEKTKRPRTNVGGMASKRLSMIDYEEHSSSDEDDDMSVDPQDTEDFIAQQPMESRSGRSRKPSLTNTNSSDTIAAAPATRRRGRGPSKRPCLNRNALMARENRQRKKEYIERIEAKLQNYQAENQELTSTIQKQNVEIKRLTTEVTYLKSVLKNQTMITTLLKSMNDSLGKMHGDGSQDPAATANVQSGNGGIAKPSTDVLNWVVSGQTNSSKTNNLSMPFSGTTTMTTRNSSESCKSDNRRQQSYGQQPAANIPVKIARKTMPFTTHSTFKTENPASVESLFEDDEAKNVQISSPQSGSFCEYITDKSSAGHDNQQPTTPMSAMSNSMDRPEASFTNTELSQLSTLNVDFLDNLDDVTPLQFDQSDLFSDDALFHTVDKDPETPTNDIFDPLKISEISEGINEKENNNLFDDLDNAGVCLHINSTRVSLEYCSICHFNSLNSEIA